MRTLITTLLAALLLCVSVHAAPAPFVPREKIKRLELCGEWIKTWSGSLWRVTFYGDGSYRASGAGGGSDYVGRWRLEGRKLTVVEQPASREAWAPDEWSVTLDDSLSGEVIYVRQVGTDVAPVRWAQVQLKR